MLALQVQGLNQSHGWNHIQWSRRSGWDSVASHGPPKKIGEDQFVGSHGFFQIFFGAKTTGSCISYVLFVYILTIHCLPLRLIWALMVQHNKGILHLRPADPSQQLPYHLQKKQSCRCSSRLVISFLWWKHSKMRSNGDAMLNIYLQQIHLKRPFRSREVPARLIGIPRHSWMTFLDALIYLDLVCMRFSKWRYLGKLQTIFTPQKLNVALKIVLPNRKVVFQPPFFWAMLYKFWGCTGGSSSCTECCCWPAGNHQHVSCVVDVDLTT